MASSSSTPHTVRDAAIKTGESCAAKLGEGLNQTAATFEMCARH
jgi:hypothetical protein